LRDNRDFHAPAEGVTFFSANRNPSFSPKIALSAKSRQLEKI
jgi:hypothetical protein